MLFWCIDEYRQFLLRNYIIKRPLILLSSSLLWKRILDELFELVSDTFQNNLPRHYSTTCRKATNEDQNIKNNRTSLYWANPNPLIVWTSSFLNSFLRIRWFLVCNLVCRQVFAKYWQGLGHPVLFFCNIHTYFQHNKFPQNKIIYKEKRGLFRI